MGFQSKGDHTMQYLLMCYVDEQRWEQMSAAQKGKLMEKYSTCARDIVTSGHCRASAKLQPTSTATTVREQNGKRVTTDGPFAETKEQLGGASAVRPVAWTSQP